MSDRIECKPTRWFLLRAAVMLIMFGVFAAMFYKDGKTGYREKNISFYTWKAVEKAAADFAEKGSDMSPQGWRRYAEKQTLELPEDRSILPLGTPDELPWPDILADYDTMEAGLGNPKTLIFDEYRSQVGMKKGAPKEAYTARKIFEQWVFFWIMLTLFIITLLVVGQTFIRKIVLEGTQFKPTTGKALDLSDLTRLDLRRWDRKGLAFAWAGERKIRIDGLVYGGFRKEDGEPAEKLMQAIRAGFSGELIEYVSEDEEESAAVASES